MPTLGDYTALRDQLATDIQAAWPDVRKIYFGMPIVQKTELPYAVVELANPESEFLTVRDTLQTYDFTVWCVEQRSSENVLDQKIARLALLCPRIEASELYALVGMNPLVFQHLLDIEFETDGQIASGLRFRCQVRRSWGT